MAATIRDLMRAAWSGEMWNSDDARLKKAADDPEVKMAGR